MRQTTLLMACSILVTGCAIARPNTDMCVVNAKAQHEKCYNLNRDYDNNGKLNPSAKPLFKPAVTVLDLDKNVCTDPDGWSNVKAYIRELRSAAKGRVK